MSERTKIYFASDFHLGIQNHKDCIDRERKIVSWLHKIKKDAAEIYLVGDVFDFWYEWKKVVPRGHVRLLGTSQKFVTLASLFTFTGNHDLWTFGYLEKEIGLKVHREPIKIELQGKKCFVGHGDGLGPGDHGYKFLKRYLQIVFVNGFFLNSFIQTPHSQ